MKKKKVRRLERKGPRKHRRRSRLFRKISIYNCYRSHETEHQQVWSVAAGFGNTTVTVADEKKPAALERARILLGVTALAWKRAVASYEKADAKERARLRARPKRKLAPRAYSASGVTTKRRPSVKFIVWGKTQKQADDVLSTVLKALGGGRKVRDPVLLVNKRRRRR